MLVLEGLSLKCSVNMLATSILYYYAAPACLINCCKLSCFLSGFARDSCNFPCGKLQVCLRETFLRLLHQFHRAFCPSSLFVLALQMQLFPPKFLDCFACCLIWYYIVRFHSGNSSYFRSYSYNCSSSSTGSSSLLFLRCYQVFLGLLIVSLCSGDS